MNKKGQALVEFIIIIPIFIMLILAVFDYVKITQTRFDLETKLEDVILNDDSILDSEILTLEHNDGKVKYILSKDITITSPVLSVFMGTKYKITCERVVYE